MPQAMCWTSQVRRMSHTEQQQVIDSLRKTNEKSNHMYRAALVTIYALVFVLYVDTAANVVT